MRIPRNPRLPWVSLSHPIALLPSQMVAALVIPAIFVFHYAWDNHRSRGLFVLTYFPGASFFKHVPCAQARVVRLESNEEWYLNSKRIEPDRLPEALGSQIGARTSCTVFFDAKSDVPYAEAIHAIDLIEQSPGRVVLLTPNEMRRIAGHVPLGFLTIETNCGDFSSIERGLGGISIGVEPDRSNL